MHRLFGADHGLTVYQHHQHIHQQHGWHHHQHIAKHGGTLGAHQVRDLVNKFFSRVGVVDIFELGSHGRCCHGRLLGGQRQVQQLDQHKTGRVHQS